MATVREALLPVVARLRGIADTKLGLRRYTVYLRTSTPSDGRGGRGATVVNVDTLLPERPRIRQAASGDVVTGAGLTQSGNLTMDLVTPRNDANTIGALLNAIRQDPSSSAPGQQVFVVLDGPGMPPYVAGPPPSGGGEFTVVASNATGNFGLEFTLSPRTGRR